MSNQVCRIAIDAREAVGQRAGKGRVVVGLLEGLAELATPNIDYILYTKAPLPADLPVPPRVENVVLPAYRLPGLRPFWLARDLRRRKADIFLSPTGFLPAILSPIPTVIIVHDLAVWRTPNHPRSVILQEKLQLPWAAKKATAVITVSANTAHDLTQILSLPPAKITIIPLGFDQTYRVYNPDNQADRTKQEEIRTKYHLPPNYLLFVGTLEPRKNIARLIEAYHDLPAQVKDSTPLLIVGKKGWHYDAIFKRVEDLGETQRVRFLGYVPDGDLAPLYSLATVAAYPSLYEGFGLPPLEALACGVPLLTSQTSSLPEVVGQAALMVDPYDVAQITHGLEKLLTDQKLRDRLRQAGPEQASQFSWLKTATLIERLLVEKSRKSVVG